MARQIQREIQSSGWRHWGAEPGQKHPMPKLVRVLAESIIMKLEGQFAVGHGNKVVFSCLAYEGEKQLTKYALFSDPNDAVAYCTRNLLPLHSDRLPILLPRSRMDKDEAWSYSEEIIKRCPLRGWSPLHSTTLSGDPLPAFSKRHDTHILFMETRRDTKIRGSLYFSCEVSEMREPGKPKKWFRVPAAAEVACLEELEGGRLKKIEPIKEEGKIVQLSWMSDDFKWKIVSTEDNIFKVTSPTKTTIEVSGEELQSLFRMSRHIKPK